MFALKLLMQSLGSPNIDCRQDGAALDPALGRGSYIFNATVAGIESADAMLIVGSNPRKEAPVLNARISKRWRLGGFPIARDRREAPTSLTAYDYLGAGPDSLARLVAGEGEFFYEALKAAKRPLIIVGQGALRGRERRCRFSPPRRGSPPMSARCSDDWIGPLASSTLPPRASAVSTSASCRARAGSAPRTWSLRRRQARSTCCSCSAPTKMRCAGRRPSSSISARMATPARTART